MTRALLGKEFREHWPVLLAMCALMTVMFGLLFVVNLANGNPPLTVLHTYLAYVAPLAAWILGGRLVRHEYVNGTQLFLDALPVARSSVILAKYTLGAIAMLAITAPAFAICALASLRGHDVDAGLLAIVGLRTAGWVWFLHAAGFLLGFLGRFRAPLLIVAGVTLAGIASQSSIEARDFGPLGLVDSTFAFEREDVPWGLFLGACAISVGASAVAWALACVREGSVAAQMAQQMSNREKAFAGVVVLCALAAIATWHDKRTKAPFDPPAAARIDTPGLSVVVGADAGLDTDAATAFASSIHDRLDAMRADLRIDVLPPVYLFARTGLDARRYERGTIEDEAGVIARANRTAAAFDDDHFFAWLVREVVAEHVGGRATKESRRWVLDGFGEVRARAGDDPEFVARALAGTQGGITADDLAHWDAVRDRVGPDIACAVAWSGLRALEASRGVEATRAFLAAALGTVPPDDIRALGWESRHGIGVLLEKHAGTTEADLLRDWNAWLAARRTDASGAAGATDAFAAPSAELRIVPVTDATREVEFTADVARSGSGAALVRFQWAELAPFATFVADEDWESDDVVPSDAAAGRRVPQSFRRGARIAWRVAVRSAALNCDVVSPTRRTVLE